MQYRWAPDNTLELVFVPGTHGNPFPFGEGTKGRPVEVRDFFIGTVPVTQALWAHVMGADANPAANRGPDLPVENVSWEQITQPGGFLDHINQSSVQTSMLAQAPPRSG